MFASRNGKLRPLWRYETDYVIWRAVPTGRGKLLCEERHLERKQTRYVCIDQSSGSVAWKRSFGEEWWIGVESVHAGVLLLHKYASPDLPEHRSIIAVSVSDGSVLWQNNEMRFEGVSERALFASTAAVDGVRFINVEIETGNVRQDFESYSVMKETMDAPHQQRAADLLFPEWTPDAQLLEARMHDALRLCSTQEKITGPVEHLKVDDIVICSHREYSPAAAGEEPEVQKVLHVVRDDAVVFAESLGRVVTPHFDESFFVEEGVLYFLKERSRLTAVRVKNRND